MWTREGARSFRTKKLLPVGQICPDCTKPYQGGPTQEGTSEGQKLDNQLQRRKRRS